MKNTITPEIYKLGKKLGLNKMDINIVLVNTNNKQTSLSLGPPWYPGNRYGVISIKKFKN